MIPTDITDYIPLVLKENITDDGQALIDYINAFLVDEKAETMQLKWLLEPERAPSRLLNELDYYFQAGFLPSDTDQLKRQKIYSAVATHKKRSLFLSSVKIIIDRITGKSSSLFNYDLEDDAIWMGDGTITATAYYMTWAGDGLDSDLGKKWIGSGEEVEEYGVVYIDLGYSVSELFYAFDSVITGDGNYAGTEYSAIGGDGVQDSMYISGDGTILVPTDTVLDTLVLNMLDQMPAYYRVFLGYTGNDGVFYILREVV